MKKLLVITLLGLGCTGCRSPYYADKAAGLGAVAGGITGALIGEHNGNALAGAAIGTAVGALSGAAVGDVIDSEVARNNALIEERLGRQLRGATTTGDVVAMSQAGVPDDVILAHIRANGTAAPLGVDEIIALNQQGVSSNVIKAMQAPPAPPRMQPAAISTPVVVEEHYYAPDCHVPAWYHHHRPYRYSRRVRHPAHRHGVSWGFSIQR